MKAEKFFLESEGGRRSKEDSLFHILPVPYEKTVSYGTGTKNAPSAIINASQQLESYDGISIPLEHGIFTHKPIDCKGKDINVLKKIELAVTSILSMKKIPVILGGEHTVSYGSIIAAKNFFKNIGVIHFDAHADLRNEYEGSKFSHACVMRRVHENEIPIIQIGTRSFSIEEKNYRDQHKEIIYYNASDIYKEKKFTINFPDNFPEKIYISVDVDAFDLSVIPHTGTPVPGGLLWYDFFSFINSIPIDKKITGFDIVELAPDSKSAVSDFAAAQLTYNLMGIIANYSVF
ncbi:MAG: agmatinase [Leptospirales bacterium]|nr:agmatinase [Leptospirales bacterium]